MENSFHYADTGEAKQHIFGQSNFVNVANEHCNDVVVPRWAPPSQRKLCSLLHLSCLSLACVFLWVTLSHRHTLKHTHDLTRGSICKLNMYFPARGVITLNVNVNIHAEHFPSALVLRIGLKYGNIWKTNESFIGDSTGVGTACPCSLLCVIRKRRDKTRALSYYHYQRLGKWR